MEAHSDLPPPEPGKPGRNVPVAIITGLSLAGLIFATLFTSRVAWLVVVGTVLLIALWEFFRTLSTKGFRPAVPLGFASLAAMFTLAAWRGPRGVTFALVLSVLGTFVWYLADPQRTNVLANVSVTIFGIVYVGVLGVHVFLMRDLKHGPAVTIGWIGLVALYDVAAYAGGSFWGKHKIAPSVSPGKTWEGAAAATVFIFALALVAGPHIGSFTVGSSAALAAAMCLAAPLGDLAESLIKRDLGVKDFGHLLPGHGGMLDRIDALVFSAPAAYWIARVLTQ